MRDDVLINKAATIERCVARAHEEFDYDPTTFVTNFSRQDAAVMNIQRACEAALDLGHHIIRRDRLGVPKVHVMFSIYWHRQSGLIRRFPNHLNAWLVLEISPCMTIKSFGGSGEIRTHGGREPSPVFKTGALNHSATLPSRRAESYTI